MIKRDEKGRFMASETKKQKTSGGGYAVKILIRGGGDAPITVVVRT